MVTRTSAAVSALFFCALAYGQSHFCDVNGRDGVNATDVQLVINAALGLIDEPSCNLNGIGDVDAIDVQIVINAALNLEVGVSVPDVVGMMHPSAREAMGKMGFSCDLEEEQNGAPYGCIIRQNPLPGSIVREPGDVALVMSSGTVTWTELTVTLPGDVPLVLVSLPGGTFMMGRSDDEQDSQASEAPRHEVTVPGFWMGKYEVTKAQWTALMNTQPWQGQPYHTPDPDTPVVYVSWEDAKSFLQALATHTGMPFRLPSEAEWEYASRAGSTTRFHWGDDPGYTALKDYAWYYERTVAYLHESYAHRVGLLVPNPFGLYDMIGGVSEVCEDDWHADYTSAPADGRPWLVTGGLYFSVARGGGWAYLTVDCRAAARFPQGRTWTDYTTGFRVALYAPAG